MIAPTEASTRQVSPSAVLQRCRRAARKLGYSIMDKSDQVSDFHWNRFAIVDVRTNWIISFSPDLNDLAEWLEVLRPNEVIEGGAQ